MKFTLTKTKEETPDVRSFIWQSDEAFTWQAGQYLHYVLPHEHADDRKEERWFTISSAPFEGHSMLTTRHASEKGSTFKDALFALAPGDTIDADTPEGDFVVEDPGRDMVFIAGGIGITPYRAILLDLDHQGADIKATLLYANRDDNFVFKAELEALAARHSHFLIHYFTGDARIDEAAIEKYVPERAGKVFYASGPEPMVEGLEKMILGMGIPEGEFKRDFFPGYQWP